MRTEERDSLFEVFDGNDTLCKINIAYRDSQKFGNTATKAEEESDKKSITQILSSVFKLLDFFDFQKCFSHGNIAIR